MKTVHLFLPALVFCCVLAARAQNSEPQPKLEYFDPNQADRSLDPCQDFYKFACNKWFAANPIPSDQSYWGTGSGLALWNETMLRKIMEEASVRSATRTPIHQKVGDFWAACKSDSIQALQAFFGFSSSQDLDNASMVVVEIDQGGMGLPSRDFYLKEDPQSTEIRSKYRLHVGRMLALSGESDDQSAKDAETVLALETGMAKVAMDSVSRRDPRTSTTRCPLTR